ncbi:Der GTPase-activating protein YihI [Thalassotalea sp. ND16A]|uniref:Der GTPase-activating protein YihI n=1 Tax=Thalassotalea sp. ND16A TaxID=1535422 RepID=UPI00051A21C0|nr:Der GTPase-activating protein YihI [Thalassotalea sp. ND16A]KGJ88118.1 hypothetical protein ND16A_2671 [Thalassotalea sp. ND16A]
MSRSKKSRKPGRMKSESAPKKVVLEEKEPRARKTSGNKAGTRQQVAKDKAISSDNATAKDPRIGSKKPIDLGIVLTPVKKVKKQEPPAKASVAPIKVIDDSENLEQELLAIESNVELQQVAAKVDSGEEVSEQEAELLATSLERYQQLIEKLGLENDEASEAAEETDPEDELWDKLDSSDLSDFKE